MTETLLAAGAGSRFVHNLGSYIVGAAIADEISSITQVGDPQMDKALSKYSRQRVFGGIILTALFGLILLGSAYLSHKNIQARQRVTSAETAAVMDIEGNELITVGVLLLFGSIFLFDAGVQAYAFYESWGA
jgi:hypothetical protein